MAFQSESKIAGPGGGGGGGREKRRSFLPAPKRPSGIPAPSFSAPLVSNEPHSPPQTKKSPVKNAPPEEDKCFTLLGRKLQVDSRILISGVKPGILRYVGNTHIAPGFWCGIELFDASGLHDGEVDGTRYFSCKPFRGIFAPADKVFPDEVHPFEEKPPVDVPESLPDSPLEEKQVLEAAEKLSGVDHGGSRIPSSKSHIARLSGIPRVGGGSAVVKSKSAEGLKGNASKIATLSNSHSHGGDAGLNSTFTVDGTETEGPLSKDPEETYSCHVEKRLQTDSRQYLNITFNKDSLAGTNLPDVVSSASPSPPRETATRAITFSTSTLSSDSLGLMDPDIIADDTCLLEGVSGVADKINSSASESDGNSSTLDETSVATVHEAGLTSTPLQAVDFKKFLEDSGGVENLPGSLSEVDTSTGGKISVAAASLVKKNLNQTFTAVARERKDSGSSANGVRAEHLQEDSSTGVSPEVSQVLEWDYDQDGFDGKLLEKCPDGMSLSTSTSDSASDASADPASHADKRMHMSDVETAQFEEAEDGFESIDDFPLGMTQEAHQMMTDSGISEKGFAAAEAGAAPAESSSPASKRRSVEFDSKVTVVEVSPEEKDGGEESAGMAVDANLQKDLLEGHKKQERPLSLVSTTSADTGYVPDTDSETGTLTANSPTDQAAEKQLNRTVKCKQSLIGRGLSEEPVQEVETDSDICSDVGNTMVDTETEPSDVDEAEKTACHEETEESEEEEDEEDEEEEETSEEEEETSSEEEEETDDDDDVADDRPEDDRIEADRVAPLGGQLTSAKTAAVTSASHDTSLGGDMAGSGVVVGSEMTESADPALPLASQQTAGKSESATSSKGPDQAGTTEGGGKVKKSSQKKKKSPTSPGEDKKIVAEHKKAIKKASSRLADYINAPLPPAREKKSEGKGKKKLNKNNKGEGKNQDNSSSNVADKSKGDNNSVEEKREKRAPRVKEEKPKVKRTVVKSKWGNIMSQIEHSKDTIKPKPKAEIKSQLAVYLSTPATPNPNAPPRKESPKKEEAPAKPKMKLVKHPKPDFSNIKSKLNIAAPPPKPKPQESPNNSNPGNPHDGVNPRGSVSRSSLSGNPLDVGNPKGYATRRNTVAGNLHDVGGNSKGSASRNTLSRKPPLSHPKGRVSMDRQETLENCSTVSQGTGSCTDLSLADGADGASTSGVFVSDKKRNSVSCVRPRVKNDRSASVTSLKSDVSAAQRSVKSMNVRNAQPPTYTPPDKSRIKSSIPPPNSSRLRSKLGGGLKSGQPPDVVSTSARGTRAQEIARLESLCEGRTKELNYTKMQLKAGLEAFDAVTCLLNYTTNQLDAFSCPLVTAKLTKAEGKLTEQHQNIECLTQQKSQLEQQVQELTAARDAAQQEVSKLKEEMTQAEEAHSAAQQTLKEEHAAAIAAQHEGLTSNYQKSVEQIQKHHEKHTEYTHHSHKRQLQEVTAEHQMATNQLKLAHLEDIQALRNKHDLQMEELHAQHRNKLEDITHRFESIKLSLSEKVQSLCVECDELRIRAKCSEDALQRDADVKVQYALAPYLNLPKEIESLKTVIDMRTEEIQKLRRQNMDLVKQLEELPIAQERVASLQQKVENLQAIINIKTDHEKQLHEKCQVLMRKYDRESRANKRLSMDYEQVMWRMSQSADLGSLDSLAARQMSHSPTRGDGHGSPSPVRRSLSNSAQGGESSNGVTRRQRRVSGGEEDPERKIRCRSATFSLDKSKAQQLKHNISDNSVSGSGSSSSSKKQEAAVAKVSDYAEMIVAAMSDGHDESFSSGHESGDMSDFHSSMESSMILETPQGVSFKVAVGEGENGVVVGVDRQGSNQDEVFLQEEGPSLQTETSLPLSDVNGRSDEECSRTDVTVVVNSPTSD
ncbi:hypothetical protein V1264_003830 [Littorina saxatilis]|uniref:CAP-Gly domain-containing protein n=1 Tax=Littorina saxatilis TaxID=31220 RepID=A0AAN9B0F4_9CAEN